jgi:hypothetical protein
MDPPLRREKQGSVGYDSDMRGGESEFLLGGFERDGKRVMMVWVFYVSLLPFCICLESTQHNTRRRRWIGIGIEGSQFTCSERVDCLSQKKIEDVSGSRDTWEYHAMRQHLRDCQAPNSSVWIISNGRGSRRLWRWSNPSSPKTRW